jgi:YebC/PmpR family DNA-binding regulatory protein
MVDALTDNRNRTVSEVRKIFEQKGGNLGDTGCVGFMFEKKGVILLPRGGLSEDAAMELGLDIGAEDVQPADDSFEITCAPADFASVVAALKAKKLEPASATLARVAKSRVDLDHDKARKAMDLMNSLEEHEDVQEIASNFNLPEGFTA